MCRVDECQKPIYSRGLCGNHYNQFRQAGTLAENALPPTGHRLTSIDADHKTGVCSICGPVDLKRKPNKWLCRIGYLESKARYNQKHRAENVSYYLSKTYGISSAEKATMLRNQGDQCGLCQKPLTVIEARVDHCHKTGIVRKILCNSCNVGLGFFLDNPALLDRAAAYIRKYVSAEDS